MSETTVILKLDTDELTILTSSLERYEEYVTKEKEQTNNLIDVVSSETVRKMLSTHVDTLEARLDEIDKLISVIEKSLDAKIEYEVKYRE